MWGFASAFNYLKIGFYALLAALPIVGYFLGRRDGKSIESTHRLESEKKQAKRAADFFEDFNKDISNAHSNKPTGADDFIERVRQSGY